MRIFILVLLICLTPFAAILNNPKVTTLSLTSPGTAEKLSSSEELTLSFIITASPTNTGRVYIGDSGVDQSTGNGIMLDPGDSVSFGGLTSNSVSTYDLSKFYFDAVNAGDKINVFYFERDFN